MVIRITWDILPKHSNGVFFFIHGIVTFVIPSSFCQPKLTYIFTHSLLSLLMLLFYIWSQSWWLYVPQPISWLIPGRGHFSFSQQALPSFTSLSRSSDPMKISLFHMNMSVDFDIFLILDYFLPTIQNEVFHAWRFNFC